jgi:hypothetical protein
MMKDLIYSVPKCSPDGTLPRTLDAAMIID